MALPSELRTRMRRERRNLTPLQQSAAAEQMAARVAANPVFVRSRKIACYFAVNGEMDPAPLLHRALAMGKSVYLPVLVPYRHNRLWFAPYHEGDPMALNRFGIPEPQVPFRQMANPKSLDLVLVPLVAFDQHCNRLGMGGGYYDRSFAFLRHRGNWRKPHLLGVAYDFQRVPRLRSAPWDVPLNGVATETSLYLPR